MKRKYTLAVAGVLASALALAGCSSDGGGSGPDTNADGKRVLTVALWNYEQTPEFEALFSAFEEKYTDIDIEPVDILADDYEEKTTTMLAGGDKTDVITMKNVTEYSRFSTRDQLLEVTDIVDNIGAENLASLDPYNVDDSYYAVPYRQDFWVLYYNKNLFDEAGLDYPDDLTWDEYAELARQLTDDSASPKVYGTYHHYWRSVIQAIAAAQTGGDLLSGDYDFFTDQYQMALDLQEEGAALNFGTAKTQQVGYRSMFETGQTAMMPMGTWYIAGIEAAVESGESDVEWGIAPMPQISVGSERVTFGSPTAFAVNKNAKNTEDAKLFVEFAASEEGAKAIAEIGVVPSFTSDAVTEAFTSLPEDELSIKAFGEPKNVVLEMPNSPNTSDISTVLDEEHDLIMVGEKSIEDGIATMEKRVTNDILNR